MEKGLAPLLHLYLVLGWFGYVVFGFTQSQSSSER